MQQEGAFRKSVSQTAIKLRGLIVHGIDMDLSAAAFGGEELRFWDGRGREGLRWR